MCKIPYAVMQPEKLVEDAIEEIISGPQKSLKDVFRAETYLDRVQNEPRDSLSERLLDSCTDRFQQAKRLHHLAVMRHELATVELTRVGAALAGCSSEDIKAFMLHCVYNMPPDEIARLLGSDVRTINATISVVRRRLDLAVRERFESRVDTPEGASVPWADVRDTIQENFQEIRSLLADIHGLYGELERWLHDFQGYEEESDCDTEQLECHAAEADCGVCVLRRSEPYKLAARLLRDYDKLLTTRLDTITEMIEFLLNPKMNRLPPMRMDSPGGLYDALAADVDRFIDTPEMSAENLRENYRTAITEDNRTPMDDQTVDEYTNVCFVVECGRPHEFSCNLNWALRVMNVMIDHPALQVKALVMAIEQAKAASAAQGIPIS